MRDVRIGGSVKKKMVIRIAAGLAATVAFWQMCRAENALKEVYIQDMQERH